MLVALLALVLTRLHAVFDPRIMGYDESLFLVQGMIWAEGGVPYVDGWLNKPPLLCAVFAATEALFGPGVTSHRILQLLALFGTTCICAWLVVVSARGRVAPVVAGVSVALVASSRGPPGDLWACMSEPLFALPLAAVAALALRGRALPPGGARVGLDLLTGATLGLAFQLRQNALLLLPLVVVVNPLLRAERPGTGAARRLVGVAATLAGFAAVQAFAGALVWPVLDHAVFWSWTWPRSVQRFDGHALLTAAAQVAQREAWRLPFVWCAALGGVVVVTRRARRAQGEERARHVLLLLWGGVSVVMTVLGDGAYPHYIVMLAPAAGVFAGIAAGAVVMRFDRPYGSTSWLAGTGALAYVCMVVMPGLVAPNYDWCEQTDDVQSSSLLTAIRQVTGRGERIYVLGSCPPLYYRARRLPAAPDFSGETLFMSARSRRGQEVAPPGPYGEPMRAREQLALAVGEHAQLVVDLRTARPDGRIQGLPVRWDIMSADADLSMIDCVLAERFVALPVRHDGVTLWVRR